MRFLLFLAALVLAIALWKSGKFSVPFTRTAAVDTRPDTELVRQVANRILVPLEDKHVPSTASAEKVLGELNTRVSTHAGAADYNRARRALTLLSTALRERQAFIDKALEKSPEGPFDKTPGMVWHDAWNRDKIIDMEDRNRRFQFVVLGRSGPRPMSNPVHRVSHGRGRDLERAVAPTAWTQTRPAG